MSLKEKFESDLLSLINRYEGKDNISIQKIELKKERDALGEKVVDVEVSIEELEVVKEELEQKSFLVTVLLPTIVVFTLAVTILEFLG